MNTTSDYTQAPATMMLAAHCACCGRALLDAESVERGIGPDCAEKYGVPEANCTPDFARATKLLPAAGYPASVYAGLVDEDAHATVNALVCWIAAHARVEGTEEALSAIEALGYPAMAARISKRFAKWLAERAAARRAAEAPVVVKPAKRPAVISVSYFGAWMHVNCEGLSKEQFAAFITIMRAVPGRHYEPEDKVNSMRVEHKRRLFVSFTGCAVLRGVTVKSERGELVLGAFAARAA